MMSWICLFSVERIQIISSAVWLQFLLAYTDSQVKEFVEGGITWIMQPDSASSTELLTVLSRDSQLNCIYMSVAITSTAPLSV